MSNARKLANLMVGTELKISGTDSDLSNAVNSIKGRLDSDDAAIQSLFTSLENKISSIKTRLDSDDTKLQALNTSIQAGIVNLVDSDFITTQIQSKINSIVSNIDSDSTALQAANEQITLIKSRLDSDSTAIQTISGIADTASRAGGVGDSDLTVVADLRNELDSEILYVRNLTLSYTNYVYTATVGQTSFTGTDDNSATLAYTAGAILVFLNGVKLEDEDFTATDGTSIVLTEPAGLSNELNIVCPKLESNYVAPIPADWVNSTQEAKILRSSWNTADDFFGRSVTLDDSGDTAIIGSDKIVGGARGYLHFFTRSGTTWTQGQTLTRTGGASADKRGFADKVVLSKDGKFAASGAAQDDNPSGGLDTGTVYMYALSGSTWSQAQILAPAGSDISNDSYYGIDIDITKDGSYVIVGASRQKAAYVYLKTGATTWALQQKITPSNSSGDDYGANVAINSDTGDTAIISHAGRDVVFIWTRSGTTWSQQAEIAPTSPNTVGGGENTVRSSVTISGDGDTIVFGDPGESAIYAYTRSGTTWSQEQKITPSETVGTSAGNISRFGQSISLSTDGNIFAVGTDRFHSNSDAETGQTQVWERSGTTWTEKKKIQSADIAAGDHFGISNAMSGDGKTLLVGAERDDDNASNAGSAFVFTA